MQDDCVSDGERGISHWPCLMFSVTDLAQNVEGTNKSFKKFRF